MCKGGKYMNIYKITLKHDNGKINIITSASNEKQARKQVCDYEKCPESAIIKVIKIKEI